MEQLSGTYGMTTRLFALCLFQRGNNEILREFICVSEVKIGTQKS